jgi:outer membrane protein OmpA-like peptidoglycan-associated protein/plastocyanin
MINKRDFAVCFYILLAVSVTGCGVLASNGLDYSSYPIPKLAVAPAPLPPPVTPPCQLPEPGQPITLEGCKIGDTIVLRGVNFEFDKAALTVNAKALLDQVAEALQLRADVKVEIDGHTDGKGSESYNQKLSEQRAASVQAYLLARSIAASRLSAKGFGKSVPIADNATDEGRELNRRVELKVIESAVAVAAPYVAATPSPASDHSAVVVLEPIPSFLQEPGAGLPTSIGVLTIVPKPVESGPSAVTSQRSLPPGYAGKHASMVGYPGSSYSGPGDVPAPQTYAAPAPEAYSAPTMTLAATGTGIAIANFAFTPETLTVAVGTTVTWTNKDNVAHVVKFSDQSSGSFSSGATYTRSFTKPGEYAYHCGIHPSMAGKIIVK